MKKNMTLLYYLCKRQLKRPSFWVILFIFPIITILFSFSDKTTSNSIRVALYAESPDTLGSTLTEKLCHTTGLFQFYLCESKEDALDDVMKKRAECGYIIRPDLLSKLDEGKKKNLIQVLVNPSSTMYPIVNEVVYSELFEEYSLHLLQLYTQSDILLTQIEPSELEKMTEEFYRSHLTDGSTFSFEYENEKNTYNMISAPVFVSPIKGMISILILLAGFCGVLNYYQDKEEFRFTNLPSRQRDLLLLLSIAAPVLLTTIIGFFCIVYVGLVPNITTGAYVLTLYSLGVIGLCTIFAYFIPNKLIFASTIPVQLLGCIVLSPVFINITNYIPLIKPVSWLFLPTIYLQLDTKKYSDMIFYTAAFLILFLLGTLLSKQIAKKE